MCESDCSAMRKYSVFTILLVTSFINLCECSAGLNSDSLTNNKSSQNKSTIHYELDKILKKTHSIQEKFGILIESNVYLDAQDTEEDDFQDVSVQSKTEDENTPFDSWSIVWYIASFGGLIAFFLIVSCSEWCCRRQVRNQQVQEVTTVISAPSTPINDIPPPAYEEFAPPSYDSCLFGKEKREYDVYVVPVHAIRPITDNSNDYREPPAYAAINIRTIAAQTQNALA